MYSVTVNAKTHNQTIVNRVEEFAEFRKAVMFYTLLWETMHDISALRLELRNENNEIVMYDESQQPV